MELKQQLVNFLLWFTEYRDYYEHLSIEELADIFIENME